MLRTRLGLSDGDNFDAALAARVKDFQAVHALKADGIPIANAVLTTDTDEQAELRMAEKGADAARVAIEMANLGLALEELVDAGEEEQ